VTSVVEKISFGDVDKDGLRTAVESLPADGGHLFQLARRPIQEVLEVRRDGVVMAADEYTLHLDGAWITTAIAPTLSLEVEYRWSTTPDMAVTNWDNDVGNFLYYNLLGPIFADGFESGDTSEWTASVPAGEHRPTALTALD
jgi:hypothetical protein